MARRVVRPSPHSMRISTISAVAMNGVIGKDIKKK
jgi:hypothetical protein